MRERGRERGRGIERETKGEKKEKQKFTRGKVSTVGKCIVLINNKLQFFIISLGGM